MYSDSTAVVGPLATAAEPHSYDLCEEHAVRLTVPRGWEVVRHAGEFPAPMVHTDDLEALADAVREAGRYDASAPAGARGASSSSENEWSTPSTHSTARRGHLRVVPPTNG